MESIAAIGFLLILYPLFYFSGEQLFPGFRAVYPVLGASLLIFSGQNSRLTQCLLSQRYLVFIGLISYPWYLWHWLFVSFPKIVSPTQHSTSLSFVYITVSFIFAWLTYRIIELRVRSATESKKRALAVIFTTLLVVIGLFGWGIRQRKIILGSPTDQVLKFSQATNDWQYPGPEMKLKKSNGGKDLYEQGAPDRKVLFYGDGHVEQHSPRVDRLLREGGTNELGIVFLTGGGCPPIPYLSEEKHPHCEGMASEAELFSQDPTVQTVVFAAEWQSYFYRSTYIYERGDQKIPLKQNQQALQLSLEALENLVQKFKNNGKDVFLISSIPEGDEYDPAQMYSRSFFSSHSKLSIRPFSRIDFEAKITPVRDGLRAIAVRTGAVWIDPVEHLCNATECPTVDSEGNPLYKDSYHLRPFVARDKATYLDQVFRKIPTH